MKFLTITAMIVFFTLFLFPGTMFAQNFRIILKSGQEIQADIYGYEGDCLRLHRDGNIWVVKKDAVKKIEKIRQSLEGSHGQSQNEYNQKPVVKNFKVGQDQLTIFEPGYVSTIGRGSMEKEMEWLKDILLKTRSDPGNPGQYSGGFITRWDESPTLSVFNANDAGLKAAEEAVQEINGALAGTSIQIILLKPNNESAKIKVIFTPRINFPLAAGIEGSGLDGRCQIRGGSLRTSVIESALIWITADGSFGAGLSFLTKKQQMAARDILKAQHWRKIILHELVHALGFFHSDVFRDSTMYCGVTEGHVSGNGRTFLSNRDKKAIRFLYNRLHPGWGADKLRETAERYWLNP